MKLQLYSSCFYSLRKFRINIHALAEHYFYKITLISLIQFQISAASRACAASQANMAAAAAAQCYYERRDERTCGSLPPPADDTSSISHTATLNNSKAGKLNITNSIHTKQHYIRSFSLEQYTVEHSFILKDRGRKSQFIGFY